MNIPAVLNLGEICEPSKVTITDDLRDGRLVIEFADGSPMTVPAHLVAPLAPTGRQLADDRVTDPQYLVLDALARAGSLGLTDHEHHPINGMPKDTVADRRLELQRRGWIRNTGDRRDSPHAGKATVWQITLAGEEALAHARATRHLTQPTG